MTQYNSLNVKLSNSELNKLKSETGLVLRLSSNMVGDNENNIPHKLLLTNRQAENLRKAFANKSSTDIKTQLSKMIQLGGFLGRLLRPLLKTGLPLIKNVIKPLSKSVLIPLGLTAAASAADPGIHKKILGSGRRCHSSSSSAPKGTTLIISNDEVKDIIDIKTLNLSKILAYYEKESVKQFKMNLKNKKEDVAWYIGCEFIRKYFSRKRSDKVKELRTRSE